MSGSLDGIPLSRLNLVERRSSEATKDVVPCEMAVMRVKPKSTKMFWGGVESVIRMFGWGHDNHTTGAFVRVGGPTGLLPPDAMLLLRWYPTSLTAHKSYAAMRVEVNQRCALVEHLSLPDVTDPHRRGSPDLR